MARVYEGGNAKLDADAYGVDALQLPSVASHIFDVLQCSFVLQREDINRGIGVDVLHLRI